MKHARILGLAFLAIFAFGALAAASAEAKAPRWTVTEGGMAKTLLLGEERTLTGETTGIPSLTAPGIQFTANGGCKSHGFIKGSGPGEPGTWTGDLHCNGVNITGAPECEVHTPGMPNGTVTTTPLSGTLVWLNPEGDQKVGLLIKSDPPNTFGALAHLQVTGCGLAGEYTANNELICEVVPVTQHVVNGTTACPQAPILNYYTNQTPARMGDVITQLQVAGMPATFAAHFVNLHLINNILWGVEPG